MVEEKQVGKILHYYSKIGVAVIQLTDTLKIGDQIRINGHTTDFNQQVDSMQSEHKLIEKAGKGETVGLKVRQRVREGDIVYKTQK